MLAHALQTQPVCSYSFWMWTDLIRKRELINIAGVCVLQIQNIPHLGQWLILTLCSWEATHGDFLACDLDSQTLQNCKYSWYLDFCNILPEESKGVGFAGLSTGNRKRCFAEMKLNLTKKKRLPLFWEVSSGFEKLNKLTSLLTLVHKFTLVTHIN